MTPNFHILVDLQFQESKKKFINWLFTSNNNYDNILIPKNTSINFIGELSSNSSHQHRLFGWPGAHISISINGSTWISANLKGSTGCLWHGRGDSFLTVVDGRPVLHPFSRRTTFVVGSDSWSSYMLVEGLDPNKGKYIGSRRSPF